MKYSMYFHFLSFLNIEMAQIFESFIAEGKGALSCMGNAIVAQIARFMGPTWGPSGADRTHVGPMVAQWTLLSGCWWSHDDAKGLDHRKRTFWHRYLGIFRLQQQGWNVYQKSSHVTYVLIQITVIFQINCSFIFPFLVCYKHNLFQGV